MSDPALSDLAAVPVTDTEGKTRPLGAPWSDRTAVLVWVRHFG